MKSQPLYELSISISFSVKPSELVIVSDVLLPIKSPLYKLELKYEDVMVEELELPIHN